MKEDLESKIEKNNGFLQWFGRIPFVKELTLASSFLGLSLIGCSKDSSNPVEPKMNRPPETDIIDVEYFPYVFDKDILGSNIRKGDILPALTVTFWGKDEDGYVERFQERYNNEGWESWGRNAERRNPYTFSLIFPFYQKKSLTIVARAIDNSGEADASPDTVFYAYKSLLEISPPTPPPPPPVIGQPFQQVTTSLEGKVTINSSSGLKDYSISVIDALTLQPVSNVRLTYQEESNNVAVIVAEDLSGLYFSDFKVLKPVGLSLAGLVEDVKIELYKGLGNVGDSFKSSTLEEMDDIGDSPNFEKINSSPVKVSELYEWYKQYDTLVANKTILTFILKQIAEFFPDPKVKFAVEAALKLNGFRDDVLKNQDTMINILNDIELNTGMSVRDYCADIYTYKKTGILRHVFYVCPSTPEPPQNLTLNLQPGSEGLDAFVYNNTPYYYVSDPGWWGRQNYGEAPLTGLEYIKASNGYTEGHTFIYFYFNPFDTKNYDIKINEAFLNLHFNNGSFSFKESELGYTIEVYPVKNSWNEGEITFSNNPGVVENFTSLKFAYTRADTTANRWYNLNVTPIVDGWVNGGINNKGIKLSLDFSSIHWVQLTFDSFETSNPGYRPSLQIKYTQTKK